MDGKKTYTESLHLHLEIIEEEILPRLPVKSLLRFRCVSKSWHSLIGSKRFIKTQHQNSTNNQTYAHSWRSIISCIEHGINQRSFYSHTDEPSPIDDPKNNHLITGVVVGSCKGLLCVLKEAGCLFLWNPATRISVALPKIDGNITKYGFGWDEESDAHKVFVGMSDDDLGQVYSSKTNSWKTVEGGGLPMGTAHGRLACGKIHWLTKSGERVYIESFDLKTEVFGVIEQPCKPGLGCYLVMVVMVESRERLSVVVWDDVLHTPRRACMMEEYGVKESWAELGKGYRVEKITGCCEEITGAFVYIESLVSPFPDEKN